MRKAGIVDDLRLFSGIFVMGALVLADKLCGTVDREQLS
jgi:hypothetical protein